MAELEDDRRLFLEYIYEIGVELPDLTNFEGDYDNEVNRLIISKVKERRKELMLNNSKNINKNEAEKIELQEQMKKLNETYENLKRLLARVVSEKKELDERKDLDDEEYYSNMKRKHEAQVEMEQDLALGNILFGQKLDRQDEIDEEHCYEVMGIKFITKSDYRKLFLSITYRNEHLVFKCKEILHTNCSSNYREKKKFERKHLFKQLEIKFYCHYCKMYFSRDDCVSRHRNKNH